MRSYWGLPPSAYLSTVQPTDASVEDRRNGARMWPDGYLVDAEGRFVIAPSLI
jgi:hypothetical protein